MLSFFRMLLQAPSAPTRNFARTVCFMPVFVFCTIARTGCAMDGSRWTSKSSTMVDRSTIVRCRSRSRIYIRSACPWVITCTPRYLESDWYVRLYDRHFPFLYRAVWSIKGPSSANSNPNPKEWRSSMARGWTASARPASRGPSALSTVCQWTVA